MKNLVIPAEKVDKYQVASKINRKKKKKSNEISYNDADWKSFIHTMNVMIRINPSTEISIPKN